MKQLFSGIIALLLIVPTVVAQPAMKRGGGGRGGAPRVAPRVAPPPAAAPPNQALPGGGVPVPDGTGVYVGQPQAPVTAPSPGPGPSPTPPIGPGHWYPGLGYYYPYDYGYAYTTYQGPPLVETARMYDPQVLPSDPNAVLPPTLLEQASEALRSQDFAKAAGLYLQLALEAGDATRDEGTQPAEVRHEAELRRLLGVALLGAHRPAEAQRAFLDAYNADATLIQRPLEGAEILGGRERLRQLLIGAVSYAQRVKTQESWLVAAMLMQAQGRRTLPDNVAKAIAGHPVGARLVDAMKP